ncbi:3-deoxy-manno-octulosonate cytidylyltransferase [Actinobacillus pleuropneumoniae]|uniref:3-deoxy-manno-octulosonate cytidylyltransferase 2 n=1 Tax=Actinobacillus pleuropneumoniae serotype 5b (strain L20) TaxID=416269 RepID=KDSB2_ACTP2|nr:3-deoxy-manno-octulosonate cytidylyltransferase [Actinobacillus pleuropneumoniae]A3N2M5.1 RecName: Full=3-deoxy-manno-octulosonate cytidylyltransferase 2; AltName: Full=CMP-2-keto-3-deoxyoctulosonic acid synthase 2; Short=CKS 2; Short=CMP-KDO synthase 2 [Actinobacillus pleuropneumoniae serovar 5b str. L20]ABN74661.1 3-deoxy-manno-octulosonate cytidylyltransferase [Actinobacillus pleuropneumoniae serovar 5b str. L20]MEE3683911.1 3-deoxy-manno-octulosonate cytidylyltransferase [Actinobacillus p
MKFTIIIPARYASTRLPRKPLLDILGKPMIQHVWERAKQAGGHRVIIATDHSEIAEVVTRFGGEVCLTSDKHSSGTERLAEVVSKMNISDDEIIVNVQGDEPLIPPCIIKQVAENLDNHQVNMATLAVKLTQRDELFNPNVVKVLSDKNGMALYFSRAAIPFARDNFPDCSDDFVTQNQYLRHIGIYAYRAGFIKQYVQWQPTALEQLESLEQLRALWNGEKIHLDIALETPEVGVDTQEDLERVRLILSNK